MKKNSHDRSFLTDQGIKAILNCTIECNNPYKNEFEYQQIEIDDTNQYDLLDYFEEAFKFIDEQKNNNNPILVHCHEGISRAPSFVIGYLVHSNKMNLCNAFLYVKEKRSIIFPNRTFFWALVRYEKKHNGEISFPLKRYYSLYGFKEIELVSLIITQFYSKELTIST